MEDDRIVSTWRCPVIQDVHPIMISLLLLLAFFYSYISHHFFLFSFLIYSSFPQTISPSKQTSFHLHLLMSFMPSLLYIPSFPNSSLYPFFHHLFLLLFSHSCVDYFLKDRHQDDLRGGLSTGSLIFVCFLCLCVIPFILKSGVDDDLFGWNASCQLRRQPHCYCHAGWPARCLRLHI